jgi:hypothetical protein
MEHYSQEAFRRSYSSLGLVALATLQNTFPTELVVGLFGLAIGGRLCAFAGRRFSSRIGSSSVQFAVKSYLVFHPE